MAGFTRPSSKSTSTPDTLPRAAPTTSPTAPTGRARPRGLARTAIGATGWAAATAATPSVKANNAVLNSAAASGAVTVTHYAI